MIHVIASVRIKEGMVPDFLEIFRANMLRVRQERGCIEYFPAVDVDTDLPPQVIDKNIITIIEKWDDMKALHDHLHAPHMLAYREEVKNIIEGVSLKVLREA